MSNRTAPPPRRVLHIIDSLDLGGAQTVLLNFAATLPAHGWHMEVACMHGRGLFTQPLQEAGVPVHSLSSHKWWPAYLWNLPRLLAGGRFDILHFHLFGSNFIAKPLAALWSRAPRLNHDHCNDRFREDKLPALWLDALTNRLSDRVVAVSRSTRDFLLQHEDLPAAKVLLQYNSVDCSMFRPPSAGEKSAARESLGLPRDGTIIGGIGRFVPQKNFALWLQAAAGLRRQHPEVLFYLAGDGPQNGELRDMAADLGLGESLRWAGIVRDRVALWRALDVFLLTSDFEGLPMTILEAMAGGCAIIASQVDGVAEILVSGEDALLCPPGDLTAFRSALDQMVNELSLAPKLAAAARAKAVARFSHEKQGKELAGLYEELLDHGKKG